MGLPRMYGYRLFDSNRAVIVALKRYLLPGFPQIIASYLRLRARCGPIASQLNPVRAIPNPNNVPN